MTCDFTSGAPAFPLSLHTRHSAPADQLTVTPGQAEVLLHYKGGGVGIPRGEPRPTSVFPHTPVPCLNPQALPYGLPP